MPERGQARATTPRGESDPRARWKAEHRRRRLRARWLEPLKHRSGVALYVLGAATIVPAILWSVMWLGAGFLLVVAGLALHGHPPSEYMDGDPSVHVDGFPGNC